MTPPIHATRRAAARPDRRRAVVATVAAALAVAALASCRARRHRTPDDAIVLLIENPVATIDPRYTLSNYETKLSRLVAPGLVTVDTPDLSPRLALAERIDRVDDLTWDATVRADARFSDGTPVTADDVAWTFTTTIAPGSDSVYRKPWQERFVSVEALDDRRVRFHMVAPLATLMTDLDFGIVAHHAADADGHFPGGVVVGAGPYRLVSLGATEIVLATNPHYAGTPPRTPRLIVKVVRDAAARILMLVGGSADLVQNAVRLDLVDDVAARPRVEVESGPSALLTYLMMNNDDPVLGDVRVRRAIAYALDREAIIAAKFSGRAVLATGLLPPGHWAYEPDVARYDHDPARARALLDEAGYPDPDGDGPQPRLHLVYKTSADQFRVAVARVIASQLGEVGIDVEVRAFEFGTFFSDIKKGAYQIATMQTSDIGEPDYYRTYFSSTRIPSPDDPNGGNRWRYRNARVDELAEAGRRELDLDRRKAMYAEIQQLVARDVPVVALWHEDNVVLHNRDVTGYQIFPNARFAGVQTAAKP
ncbi:MAG: ABC transporter substrate-binding protein [Kofleriaceae bacterium]|nr:ABC transporter substrate-binding protein [Myxococcales bacterium]MCB9574849.1 ABC transporter substrate-binding protein [Kofleriaceae bacterium]